MEKGNFTDLREKVRGANPILEVIEDEKIELRQSGENFIGFCPFHDDQNTPNLTIYPESESFYCFACDKGGDVFTFIMQKHNIGFFDALLYLAKRKNIDVVLDGNFCEEEQRSRHIEPILSKAAYAYHKNLPNDVRRYLHGRGLADDIINKYLIGYCDGKAPIDAAGEELAEAGLISTSGNEFFKGFITFPHIYRGRIVYISGRGYPEKKHKRLRADRVPLRHLFNEQALYKPDVIITECETDTLSLLQHGFNACGLLGALNFKGGWEKRFSRCKTVYICLDNDEAGEKGALKTAKHLIDKARIVKLPEEVHDVNDYFKNGTKEGFQRMLDESLDLLEYKISKISPNTSAVEAVNLLDPILQEIAAYYNEAKGDILLRHFVKEHFKALTAKDIESLHKLLKRYRKTPSESTGDEKSYTKEELIEMVKEEKNIQVIHPAQDFINNVMYFNTKIKDSPYLISSERKLIPFEDAENCGFRLESANVDVSRFSNDGIVKYLTGDQKLDPMQLFKDIVNYIKRFVFFSNELYPAYLALWTMGTYVFRVFRYYPYLWLNAEKVSGKTLLMEVMSKVAFNGDLITNPTEAVIFRDTSANQISMFIDEVENLRDQDKESYGAILRVLNAGFSKSGTVKRVEKLPDGTFASKRYSAYSPKVLAGINEIDEVLQDRTVRISLLRKKDDEIVQRYKESLGTLELQGQIRDGLYRFALDYADAVYSAYCNSAIEKSDGVGHLNNRELDIWEPIFVLAGIVDGATGDTGLVEQMKKVSAESQSERLSDNKVQNETYKLLTVAKDMLKDIEPFEESDEMCIFEASRVFTYFKAMEEYSWLEKPNALTRRLKKIFVRSEQKSLGDAKIRVYKFDKRKIRDLCERYKI